MRVLFALLFALSVASLSAQLPEVAPGLSIPNGSGSIPLALDQFQGKPELVPVHHSNVDINNHTGSNVAGGLALGPFYKPKANTELAGAHAHTALHDANASFYVHLLQDDPRGDTTSTTTWAIVRATINKDRRVFARIQFGQLGGKSKRNDGLVESQITTLPNGWLKITPTGPLAPGEYAISPIFKNPQVFSEVIYDFTLDPAAPNAEDAVLPNPQ